MLFRSWEGTKNNMVELRANISIISITEDELKCYIKINNLRFDLKANSTSPFCLSLLRRSVAFST